MLLTTWSPRDHSVMIFRPVVGIVYLGVSCSCAPDSYERAMGQRVWTWVRPSLPMLRSATGGQNDGRPDESNKSVESPDDDASQLKIALGQISPPSATSASAPQRRAPP